jgi:hypothetical protein
MHWQKASGYNRRSKVEASIGRYKRVIGDALKSRADDRRKAEVGIAVKALNRMRELGQAQFYVIFIKERTHNQGELDLYKERAPAALAGHPITFRPGAARAIHASTCTTPG